MDLGSERFDLRAAAERGAWLQLLDPIDGTELGVADGKPCRILLQGMDSLAYEKALAHSVALRSKETPRSGAGSGMTVDRALQNSVLNRETQSRELADLTLRWENFEWDGEEFPHSHENAVKLYSEHNWIREQAIAHFIDRSRYAGNA